LAGEIIFKIREHLAQLVYCLTCSVRLGSVLRKDEEFAIDFTYDMKKLLLTVVTLVSSLILTLVVTNVNVIMAVLRSIILCIHYILQLWFLSSSFIFFHLRFFLAYSQRSEIECLPLDTLLQFKTFIRTTVAASHN